MHTNSVRTTVPATTIGSALKVANHLAAQNIWKNAGKQAFTLFFGACNPPHHCWRSCGRRRAHRCTLPLQHRWR